MSLAHWGNSQVTGRGLLALVGKGQVYQITLKVGEEYVVHPSNLVAYTVTQTPPLPYRFSSSTLRLQVPGLNLGALVPNTKFFRVMHETATWQAITGALFRVRTWARRWIWGDRLFLKFQGPSTILLQSRASRISDVLTARDIAEIADSPAGAAQSTVQLRLSKEGGHGSSNSATSAAPPPPPPPTSIKYATVKSDGKVEIRDS
ncbi:hypothetical protein LTR04_000363 [Oleoguttula sp. CCFEE 6159]|nr:hypothetical protein LTR04_000363 [Oleoguttula sp. CCFEE 6159]